MDTPLYVPIAVSVISAIAGKYFDHILAFLHLKPPPEHPDRPSFEDSIRTINERITDGFRDQGLRTDEGFASIQNAFATHVQVHFARLEREVKRLDGAIRDHTGRDHEEHEELDSKVISIDRKTASLDSRVVSIEEGFRRLGPVHGS